MNTTSTTSTVTTHPGSHPPAGSAGMSGRPQHYVPPATNGFYNANMQYHHHQQEIRQAATAGQTSSASNGGYVGGGNAYHYAYPSQQQQQQPPTVVANGPAVAPSPHLVGLPPSGFMTGHSMTATPW